MKKLINSLSNFIFEKRFRLYVSIVLIGFIIAGLLTDIGCDFRNPADFDTPTWNVNLNIPLIEERYNIGEIVDSVQIFQGPDSGMQIIFEGDLPDTSIDPSFLRVIVNEDVPFDQDPIIAPTLSVTIDTTIPIPPIQLAPGGLIDTSYQPFNVPPGTNKTILAETWNTIAAAFDTTIIVDIELPEPSDLPEFITSIDAIVIQEDSQTDSSMFMTYIKNNGIPTAIQDINFRLLTDTKSPLDTLAHHANSHLSKDQEFPKQTLIGGDSLGSAIRMEIGLALEQDTLNNTLTINEGDSVQINMSIRLRISGFDRAVVQIAETDISPELPEFSFQSDIEIYSGEFADVQELNVNEIRVSNLKSTFPFNINFTMNFRNFIPPIGQDSVKIDTVLGSNIPTYSKIFDINSYTFANPLGEDSALTALIVDVSAILDSQQTTIPLDGSELGKITGRVRVDEFQFESLLANIFRQFPTTTQSLEGMPQGFTGMAFTDVKIEFIMFNQIQLPVMLDVDMVGVNTFGDSSIVSVSATMGSPETSADTTKTVIRLSREGTTTLIYDSPSDSTWSDSSTVPPRPGESTIVDLLSFDPATIVVNSTATIVGKDSIIVGATIGGAYRLLAPFEVWMDEMRFIPVTKTPIEEMDHDTRIKLRSSLVSSSVTARVINHIPIGGSLSILFSNKNVFPLDTTTESLEAFRDSMVVNEGWDSTDIVYIVNACSLLTPSRGDIYIFNVMSDSNDCIDGLSYLIRSSNTGVDTVISYIDTLIKIILPDPDSLYTESSTEGREGAVYIPGDKTYSSIIDTNSIWLLSDLGQRYVVPMINLNGTIVDGDTHVVYISMNDYIEIKSFMTFQISSTGLFEEGENELLIVYPNGGQTFVVGDSVVIRWRSLGEDIMGDNVGVFISIVDEPEVDEDTHWSSIADTIDNTDSFIWVPSESDTGRHWLRVCSESRTICDMSGWYFDVVPSVPQSVRPPDLLQEIRIIKNRKNQSVKKTK